MKTTPHWTPGTTVEYGPVYSMHPVSDVPFSGTCSPDHMTGRRGIITGPRPENPALVRVLTGGDVLVSAKSRLRIVGEDGEVARWGDTESRVPAIRGGVAR